MRMNGISVWLKRIALLILLAAATASSVAAQTPQQPKPDLETALVPGMTAWITDSRGREEKIRIVGVSGDILTATTGENVRRLRTTDVARVRVRHSDSVLNGALIGAGVAVASGLFVCRMMEPWENCRDDVGPMLQIGAIGAGVGIGIDALIRGRKTIYPAPPGSTRLHAAPIIAGRAAGLQIALTF